MVRADKTVAWSVVSKEMWGEEGHEKADSGLSHAEATAVACGRGSNKHKGHLEEGEGEMHSTFAIFSLLNHSGILWVLFWQRLKNIMGFVLPNHG